MIPYSGGLMTRKSLQLVLAAVLLLPVTATGLQEEQEEPKLTFNFREARIETVLKYVCEQLGWTYVFENTSAPTKGSITAISDGEISPEQALVLLDTSLRQHGLATLNPYAPRMPRKGETIKIVTVKDAMKKNLEVRFGSDPEKIAPTDKVITQIIPLKGASVDSIQKELGDTIKACIAPDGTFSVNSYSNSLVITGRSEGIRRAALILKVIDVEAVDELNTRVFPLQNADATETSKILADIFKEEKESGGGSRGGSPRWMEFFGGGRGGSRGKRGGDTSPSGKSSVGNVVRVIADTRTNSIVAVATEDNMKTIETLIKQLDEGSAEMIKMKFYPLQYADAEDVSIAIKEVFAENDSSKSGQQSPWWMGRGRQQQKKEEPVASSREVKAVADVRTNAVIVAASERNFELIDDLVRSLDRQISDMLVVKVYELQNAEADGMATILRDIFRPQVNATRSAGRTQQGGGGGGRGNRLMQMMGGNQRSGSSSLSPNEEIEITSDERTNAVIVKASPEYIKIMDEVVLKLDQNPTESMSTYVLPLRFADAPDIAEVIRDLLDGSRGSSNRNSSRNNTNSSRNSNNRNSQRNGGRNSGGNRGGNLGPLEQEEDLQDPLDQEGSRRGVDGQVDVQADEDSNALVIRTSPRNYEAIQNIVNNLDRLRPQVLIKVLIADVTLDDTMKFGVEGHWENKMTVQGGDSANNRFGTDFSLASEGFTYTLTGDEFSGALNMYAQEGRLKILATPRILVLNNQTANINIGKQVPIISNTTVNSLGNTVNTDRYEDVGIILEVTPHINPDGLVTMEVKPEVSDIAPSTESVQITEGVTSPTFLINSAETTVAVHNGQTVVIGGLIREVVDKTNTKVPILGDIPLLGWLFRYSEENVNRRELMIFLTPYVAYTIAELEELSDLEKARLKIIDQKDIESESDKWLDRVRH